MMLLREMVPEFKKTSDVISFHRNVWILNSTSLPSPWA